MSDAEINPVMLKLAELKLKLQLFELIPQLRFVRDEKKCVLGISKKSFNVIF